MLLPAVETALRLATRLQKLGYFGPLGVDAMQYRDDAGRGRLRRLQDINARYTMGRLALGFRRILPAGWCGSWLHFRAKCLTVPAIEFSVNEMQRLIPREARLVSTSPRQIGSRPAAHQAVVVLAPTIEILKQAESAVSGFLGMTGAGGFAV
jgi:hypothetical protein